MTVPDDPDEQDSAPSGWRTIEPWELALFIGTLIVVLVIWNAFVLVHRGAVWPFR